MNIIPSDPPAASDELVVLVEHYLDQRLDEAGGKRLEQFLRDDPQARAYCAERIRLHSDLHALARPLRIEIHEGRDIVIEQEGMLSTVTAQQTGRVSVAPALEGPAPPPTGRWPWLAMAGLATVVLAAVATWGVVTLRSAAALRAAPLLSISPLENPSFETDGLDDGATSDTAPGWEMGGGDRCAVVINPATDAANNPFGEAHLPSSESRIDGSNILVLACNGSGETGWAKQRLYGQTAIGAKTLQLADLDARTIRVTMILARPAPDSGRWTNDVHLAVGIQEDRSPWRMAAIHRIDTGSGAWEEADRKLGLDHGGLTTITFDLKVEQLEMRGDAYFHLEVAPSIPPGAEIYIDRIQVELVE